MNSTEDTIDIGGCTPDDVANSAWEALSSRTPETTDEELVRDIVHRVEMGIRLPDERLQKRIRLHPDWLKKSPKRGSALAASYWDAYIDGMTVGAYLAKCPDRRRARRALRWDRDRGYIYLQDPDDWAAELSARQSGESCDGEE